MATVRTFLSLPSVDESHSTDPDIGPEHAWFMEEVFTGGGDIITRRHTGSCDEEFQITSEAEVLWSSGNSSSNWAIRWRVWYAEDDPNTTTPEINKGSSHKPGKESGSTMFGPRHITCGLATERRYRLWVTLVRDGSSISTDEFFFWVDRSPSISITSPASGSIFTYENGDSFNLTWDFDDPDEIFGSDPAPASPGWYEDYCGWEFQYRAAGETEWKHTIAFFNDGGDGNSWRKRSAHDVLDAHTKSLHINIDGEFASSPPKPYVNFGPGAWETRLRVFDYGAFDRAFTDIRDYSFSEWEHFDFEVLGGFLAPELTFPIDDEAVEDPDPDLVFNWDFRDPRYNIQTDQCGRAVRIREAVEGGSPWTVLTEAIPVVNRYDHPNVETVASVGAGGWVPWSSGDNDDPVQSSAQAKFGTSSVLCNKGTWTVHNGIATDTLPMGGTPETQTFDEPGTYRLKGYIYAPAATPGTVGIGITDGATSEVPSKATTTLKDQWVELTTTVDIADPEALKFVFVYATDPGDVYVDGIIITKTDREWDYFDGDTPDTADYTYAWLGTPGDSLSERVPTTIDGDPEEEFLQWTNGDDGFTVEPGKRYEWQVRTVGCPGNRDSGWEASPTGSFWVVAQPESGPGAIAVGRANLSLGCGTHQVFAYERGGLHRLGEIGELSLVRWDRVRDDVSKATVRVSGWSRDCGRLLSDLRSFVHEIVIFRDGGSGPQRVWEGPITLLEYQRDQVEIQAGDVMTYPYRRILRQGYSDAYRRMRADEVGIEEENSGLQIASTDGEFVVAGGRYSTWRAKKIIQNALAYDDPNVLPYLTRIHFPDDAREVRSAQAFSRTAWQEVDDMAAKAGLDYTTVGRRIILFDTHQPSANLPDLTEGDFDNSLIVTEYGMRLANVYGVTNNNGLHGLATRNPPDFYGYVEMLVSSWGEVGGGDESVLTDEERDAAIEILNTQAERGIGQRWPTPVVARVPDNSRLSPDAPLDISQLIPGAHVTLRATDTLRKVANVEKLDHVRVEETEKGESIYVTFSQASGFFDPDQEEEGE